MSHYDEFYEQLAEESVRRSEIKRNQKIENIMKQFNISYSEAERKYNEASVMSEIMRK